MCTVVTHPAVPLALSVFLPAEIATPQLLFAAAFCSIAPDFDVIGHEMGLPHDHPFGHRGFTHSIAFALGLAAFVTWGWFPAAPGHTAIVWCYLFLATLSHPLLDALTNGGLGVALFAPFSNRRWFFPIRPIEVSPIGWGFFSRRGLAVLVSEVKWVWAPSAVIYSAVVLLGQIKN